MSPACKHCYAEAWSRRLGMDLWSKGAPRRVMSDAYWRQPLAWDQAAGRSQRRDRVFCASMADVFEHRDDLRATRQRLWDLIASTPNLDWLLLTKRPQHIAELVPWGNQWPNNVWLGTTVETQRWAEKRLPQLLQHPAAVLFLSCEPLLGPVDLSPWLSPGKCPHSVDWVIVGGESGHGARAMNPQWARSLRDQCAAHGVAYHFKQWGNWRPSSEATERSQIRLFHDPVVGQIHMINVGKKHAGRTLDGREWDELPWHA